MAESRSLAGGVLSARRSGDAMRRCGDAAMRRCGVQREEVSGASLAPFAPLHTGDVQYCILDIGHVTPRERRLPCNHTKEKRRNAEAMLNKEVEGKGGGK